MHPNTQTLNKFYAAFAALDADTMASCYAEDAEFEDPAFSLKGRHQVGGMWRMLCATTQAKGHDVWKLEYSNIEANATQGQAHWEAHYRFSATGRLVHNIIDAKFSFTPEGLIGMHRDHFDFWRWSRQALGAPGLLLGWTPFFQTQVRTQAEANLQKFLTKAV